jgi:5'-3' exonuclease
MDETKEIKKDIWDELLDKEGKLTQFGPPSKPWKNLGKDTKGCIHLLIDGDIVAYRASAPCDGKYYAIRDKGSKFVLHKERYKKDADKWVAKHVSPKDLTISIEQDPEPEGYAIYNVDQIMGSIIGVFSKPFVKVYLTGNVNFRTELYPQYKANRKAQKRPVHLNACKQHLLNRYKAVMEEPWEADDLIGVEATTLLDKGKAYSICTIDKDLNCIPGDHYNFVKDTKYCVSPHEALLHFYTQVLTGDNTDNIPGIKGVGPKTAAKILDGVKDEEEMYLRCYKAWAKSMFPEEEYIFTGEDIVKVEKAIRQSAELLWISRRAGELWSPPIEELKA